MILPTVLIVNTSPLIGKYLSRIVQQQGYNFTVVTSGSEALTLSLQCCFDVIVLETEMPDWSGCDLIRLLRKLNSTRGIPVVLLTPEACQAGDLGPGLSRVLPVDRRNLSPARLLSAIDTAIAGDATSSEAARMLFIVTPLRRSGQSLARLCAGMGYDVLLIPEVSPAIEKAPHVAPDAILLHYSHSKGKHAVLADTVLANPSFTQTPLLLLSDREEAHWARERLKKHPLKACLINPVDSGALRQHVDQLCEIKEQRRALQQVEGVLGGIVRELDRAREQNRAGEAELAVARKYRRNLLPRVGRKLENPAMEIAGLARALLETRNLPTPAYAALNGIFSASRDLLRITQGIGHLVDLERGTLKIKRRRCSPLDIIWKLEDEFRARADLGLVDFTIAAQSALPREITTDPERLREAVAQLIYNAFQSTTQGEVAVSVDYAAAENLLYFIVSDSGPGIAELRLPTLFDPPWLREDYDFGPEAGLGMGLPFVKQIVDKLDGSLHISSQVGGGCRFKVGFAAGLVNNDKLELGPLLDQQRPLSASIGPQVDATTLSGNIIVAVDSVIQRELYQLIFRDSSLNYSLTTHQRLRESPTTLADCDLLLVDQQAEAPHTIAQLRDLGFFNPIIAVLSPWEANGADNCLQAGANATLSKPFDAQQLFRLLEFYLQTQNYSLEELISAAKECPDSPPPPQATAAAPPLHSELEGLAPELTPMIQEFLSTLADEYAQLLELYEDGSWPRLAKAARELSGNAGLFGYEPVATAALQLYQAAEKKSHQGATEALRQLEALSAQGPAAAQQPKAEGSDTPLADAPEPPRVGPPKAPTAPMADQTALVAGFQASLHQEFGRVLQAFEKEDWRRVAFVSNELAGAASLHGRRDLCELLLQVEQCAFRRDAARLQSTLAAVAAELDTAASVPTRAAAPPCAPPTTIIESECADLKNTPIETIVSELTESNPELLPLIEDFLADLDNYLDRLQQALGGQSWPELQNIAHEAAGTAGMYGYPQYRQAAKKLQSAAEEQAAPAAAQALQELRRISAAMQQPAR